MYAGANKLNNLCVVLDNNKMQNETLTRKTLNVLPIKDKWESFNWRVHDIDGHSFKDINNAFEKFEKEKNKPTTKTPTSRKENQNNKQSKQQTTEHRGIYKQGRPAREPPAHGHPVS